MIGITKSKGVGFNLLIELLELGLGLLGLELLRLELLGLVLVRLEFLGLVLVRVLG